MRIHLTTVTNSAGAQATLEAFETVAGLDAVGRHALEPDPDRADAVLQLDAHLMQRGQFLDGLREHALYRQRPERWFSYNKRDDPVYTLPGIYVSATPAWRRRLPVLGGPYCPLVTEVAASNREPDLLYSFRGSPTSPLRERLFALPSHPKAKVELNEHSVWTAAPGHELILAQARYMSLLKRSKFVLCPAGHGPSSHRIFETLAAGRVPVIISDRWLAPPRIDWERACLQVPERDVGRIPEILAAAESRWDELAAGAASAARELAQDRVWDHLAESVSQIAALPRPRIEPAFVQIQKARLRAGLIRRRLAGP